MLPVFCVEVVHFVSGCSAVGLLLVSSGSLGGRGHDGRRGRGGRRGGLGSKGSRGRHSRYVMVLCHC